MSKPAISFLSAGRLAFLRLERKVCLLLELAIGRPSMASDAILRTWALTHKAAASDSTALVLPACLLTALNLGGAARGMLFSWALSSPSNRDGF